MLVLLDRDGVINEDVPTGVLKLDEFRYLDGALEAIALLTKAGHQIAIVTNQSAVSKGWTSQETVDAVHETLVADARAAGGEIHAIYVCMDHPDHPTHRRKPNPGMIEEALAEFDAQPSDAILIGDALRDLEAAKAAGVPRMLVKTGKGAKLFEGGVPEEVLPVDVFDNLLAAAKSVCKC